MTFSSADRVEQRLFTLVHAQQITLEEVVSTPNLPNKSYVSYLCDECQTRHLITSTTWSSFVQQTTTQELHRVLYRILSGIKAIQEHQTQIPGWREAWELTEQKVDEVAAKWWTTDLCLFEDKHHANPNICLDWMVICPSHGEHLLSTDFFRDMKNYLCIESHYEGLVDFSSSAPLLPALIRLKLVQYATVVVEKYRSQAKRCAYDLSDRKTGNKSQGKHKNLTFTPKPDSCYIIPPAYVPADLLLEFNQCGRKTRHETEEAAVRACLSNHPGSGKTVYQCGYCDGYHYGTRPVKKNMKKAKQTRNGLWWYGRKPYVANSFIMRVLYS